MRALALAVVLAVLATGCARPGGPDAPPTPPTTTSPAPTPTPAPEPTPTSPPPPTATTPPPPTPPPSPTPSPTPTPEGSPKEIADIDFDFAREGDPTGRDPRSRQTDPVPEGYAVVRITRFECRATSVGPSELPASASVGDPTLTLIDPAGQERLSMTCTTSDFPPGFPTSEGEWTLRFAGAGSVRMGIELTAFVV